MKYDSNEDGQLTCVGFLDWNLDNAIRVPESVYRDLKAQGWRQDLVHESNVKEIAATMVSQDIILPQDAVAVLSSVKFQDKVLTEANWYRRFDGISILLAIGIDLTRKISGIEEVDSDGSETDDYVPYKIDALDNSDMEDESDYDGDDDDDE